MATPKQCHTLISYYTKKYTELTGEKPTINAYNARWGFDAVLLTIDMDETKSLIDYYFTTSGDNGYDLVWFFRNYDRLMDAQRAAEKDARARAALREESKKRAEEWRNRVDYKGITSN